MEIKLYNTKNENNTINKTLENETVYNIRFKDIADVKKPVVILNSSTFLNFNYAYIPDFKRYYFIENIEIQPNNIYKLSLSVDVLESFKNDILNSNGFISRQTDINNYYNTEYASEIKKQVDIYKSNVTIDLDTKTKILVTIGGI